MIPGVLDDVFDALSHVHRRRVLVTVLRRGCTDDNPVVIPGDMEMGRGDPKHLHALMHHTHLPILEEVGFIRCDRNRGTVEVSEGPRFDDIEPVLNLLDTHADDLPGEWA